jgi:hypothetical protein
MSPRLTAAIFASFAFLISVSASAQYKTACPNGRLWNPPSESSGPTGQSWQFRTPTWQSATPLFDVPQNVLLTNENRLLILDPSAPQLLHNGFITADSIITSDDIKINVQNNGIRYYMPNAGGSINIDPGMIRRYDTPKPKQVSGDIWLIGK